MIKMKPKFINICYKIDYQVHDGHIPFNKKGYFIRMIEWILYLLNITNNTQAVSF